MLIFHCQVSKGYLAASRNPKTNRMDHFLMAIWTINIIMLGNMIETYLYNVKPTCI